MIVFVLRAVTLFLSTPSARRATHSNRRRNVWISDFYPRPPRGGRLHVCGASAGCNAISIHALREEGDSSSNCRKPTKVYFYPRPPRGGRRHGSNTDSTSSTNFYPRPPRGGRPHICSYCAVQCWYFYPRPPRGGRQSSYLSCFPDISISIHALREEGDCCAVVPFAALAHFYPRPPRGGRHTAHRHARSAEGFLSTPSARRATQDRLRHAHHSRDFYPRPPRGGRRGGLGAVLFLLAISIHALREEGDGQDKPPTAGLDNFYPRPPRGGRRAPRAALNAF